MLLARDGFRERTRSTGLKDATRRLAGRHTDELLPLCGCQADFRGLWLVCYRPLAAVLRKRTHWPRWRLTTGAELRL